MSTVTQAREAIEALQSGIIRLTGEAMQEHEHEIVQLLVDQQEYEGVDSNNRPLSPYTRSTVKLKQARGTYVGHTNFRETGEFHNTLSLEIEGENYVLKSPAKTDRGELKSDWLRDWNGSPIMELTPDNVALVYPIIEDTLKELVNSELALD